VFWRFASPMTPVCRRANGVFRRRFGRTVVGVLEKRLWCEPVVAHRRTVSGEERQASTVEPTARRDDHGVESTMTTSKQRFAFSSSFRRRFVGRLRSFTDRHYPHVLARFVRRPFLVLVFSAVVVCPPRASSIETTIPSIRRSFRVERATDGCW
jgi:hypothetical protein